MSYGVDVAPYLLAQQPLPHDCPRQPCQDYAPEGRPCGSKDSKRNEINAGDCKPDERHCHPSWRSESRQKIEQKNDDE
jgi:hypothetical protein